MKTLKCIAVLATLLIPSLAVHAQTDYRFENISTDQGLSNGWVRSVLQDSKGYLWFGTNQGLNRYDGYQFKVFETFPENGNHLGNSAIWDLKEDKDGKIWIGTDGGLNVFDPVTEKFTSYESLADSFGVSKRIRGIAFDKEGRGWLAAEAFLGRTGSLVLFDKDKREFHPIKEGDLTEYARKIVFDEFGNLWLACGKGILIFDPVSKKVLKHIYRDAHVKSTLAGDDLSSILREKNNTMWVTTWKAGISKIMYDKNLNVSFENYQKRPSGRNGLVSNIATSMIRDKKGNLWISTLEGVSVFNPSRDEIVNLTSRPGDPDSFKESSSWIVFEDKRGMIWVGHNAVGISRLKNNKGFIRISQSSNQETSLAGNNISALSFDSSGKLWAGVVDGGLHKIDFHGDYSSKPSIEVFPSKLGIRTIARDQEGTIWFGTADPGGLYRLNSRSKQFETVSKATNFYLLVFDSDWNVWSFDFNRVIKINGSDLRKADPPLKQVLPDNRLKSLQRDINFSGIIEDEKKRIWATNWQGEILFHDPKTGKSVSPEITTSVTIDFEKARIPTFYIDKRNYLWTPSLEGLCKYKIIDNDDPEKVALHLEKVYRKEDGLSTQDGITSLYINAILEDIHGNLWLSHKGLSVLNPSTNAIKSYYMDDGLPANELGVGCVLEKGFLAFASTKGIILFHPDSLKDNTYVPPAVITEAQLLNRSIAAASLNKSSASSGGTVEYPQQVTVPYDSNVLGFEFAALDFTASPRNQYAYQMVGFDPDWVYAGKKRTATYTNLDQGTYTFRVKGSNNDGVWNEAGTSILVTILPPPWKTWWAYLLYSVLFVSLAYLLWKRWATRVQLKVLATIKTAEAEKLREIDTLKSNFFANISHEFRTPLTLILGPLGKRLASSKEPSDRTELEIMQRNAFRLLTLVNQLLDLSRLEARMLTLKCQASNLYASVLSISSQFSSIADSKGIDFRVEGDQSLSLYFDQDKFEKIVVNLLSNAFKFTSAKGRIIMVITAHEPTESFRKGFAQITVTDTGTGIGAEHLPRIFDRFYQADMSSTRLHEGTGIGLALTKELVELHHGSIAVTSEPGQGTTFTVRLPLGSAHLKPEEIVDTLPGDVASSAEVEFGEPAMHTSEMESQQGLEESVLIIEDNADLRSYLLNELNSSFKILLAKDGSEGISVALRELPTLVITDLMMPGKDGLAVCHELKEDERTSHIPIILLTAKADIESKLSGLRQGADDYIPKPFNLAELQLRIKNLISIRKNLRSKFAQRLTVLPSEIPVESADNRFLKKAVDAVEAHLADSMFAVDNLAQQLAVSQAQLYRKLHAVTGSGPNEFIRHIRLLRAADLLRNEAGGVSEIAYQVGFNNLSYFSKVFKEKFGVAPNEFRKNPK